ncbi:hypothetical protein [Blastococcus goldschmidtiae]|uniref:DUF916 domain-containing protein n=1 Tax=Blastococcus goldschmidtiae TaxID=3075546 RepID=A0ABU2K743_9ACTN|nr:hypothetical protein [Blastococcus sp. DSM 46792]MDT0276000.1 hypothetical protein [Blastococcus sp. DSM 46792]
MGAPSAHAAPAATVVLDPGGSLGLRLHATENVGPVNVAAIESVAPSPVAVSYGGSVTIDLPDLVDGVPTQALLELYPSQEAAAPTRVYDSASAVPADQIAMTDLGAGQYRIDLPVDDGVNGPLGLVWLKPLESSAGHVTGGTADGRDIFGYWLQFSSGGPAAVTLSPQLVLSHWLDAPAVRAGEGLDVTLPATSGWSAHGFTSLAGGAFTMHAVNDVGHHTGTSIPLTPVVSADARTASLSVPTGTPAGRYEVRVVLGAGTDRVLAETFVRLEILGAVNPGLVSETSWTEDEPAAAVRWPLVGLGVGMVLAAGTVGAVVVRSRRTAG